MKKRFLSILLTLAMFISIMPMSVFATETEAPQPATCSCETKCTAEAITAECALCGAENADLAVCTGAEPQQEEPVEQPTTQPTEQPTQPQQLMYGIAPVDDTVTSYNVWAGGVQFTSANLTINGDDGDPETYDGTATLTIGGTAEAPTYTVTLNNFKYIGEGYCFSNQYGYDNYALVYSECDIIIKLIGNNTICSTVNGSQKSDYAIYADGDLTVTDNTADNTDGILNATSIVSDAISVTNGHNLIISNITINTETVDGTGIYCDGEILISNAIVESITSDDFNRGIYGVEGVKIENSNVIAKSGSGSAIFIYDGDLNVLNSTLEATSGGNNYGIDSTDNNYNIIISGDSTVITTGGLSAYYKAPTLEGTYKVSAGGTAPGTVVTNPTPETFTNNKYVKISPEEYGIWIGKTQITAANKDDITAAINDGSNGTASGSATYDPETNTLTFRDFTYSGPSAVNDLDEKALYIISNARTDNFTFKFYGNNTLSCTEVVDICGIVDIAGDYIAESGALGSSMTFMFAGYETGIPSAGSGVKIEKGTSDKTTSDGTPLRYVKLYSELPTPTAKPTSKSADGGMDMIYADGKEIAGFDRLVFNYTLDVPYEQTSVTFTGKMSHPGAWADNLWGIPLKIGANTVVIKTTAEDGKTNWFYTITVNRAPEFVAEEPAPAPTVQPTVEPTATPAPTAQPTQEPATAPTATPAPTSAPQQVSFPWWIVAAAAVALAVAGLVAKKKHSEE